MKFFIPIKALSINAAYTGRRFKTPEYKSFEKIVGWELKSQNIKKKSGWIEISYKFHLSNFMGSDVSNFIKITEDVLVKCEIIDDDRFVKRFVAEKFKVKKGKEKIEIQINQI